jgi:hypothetical protein
MRYSMRPDLLMGFDFREHQEIDSMPDRMGK